MQKKLLNSSRWMLLNDQLARRPAYTVDTIEVFLYRSALAEISLKEGNTDDAYLHRPSGTPVKSILRRRF